jgi:hypothetical protein
MASKRNNTTTENLVAVARYDPDDKHANDDFPDTARLRIRLSAQGRDLGLIGGKAPAALD